MPAIIIKRKVSLDFLGEEQEQSYALFKAIAVKDLPNIKGTIQEVVTEYFIEGKIAQDDGIISLTKENLAELPTEFFVTCFARITGEQLDPKS